MREWGQDRGTGTAQSISELEGQRQEDSPSLFSAINS
jgi:hypothetical protein